MTCRVRIPIFCVFKNISTNDFELFDSANPTNTWGINGFGFSFPTNITLQEAETLYVINGDEQQLRSRLGLSPYIRVFDGATGRLEGNGERITLQRPDSPEPNGQGGFYAPMIDVDAVRYDNKASWPTTNTSFYLRKSMPDHFGNDPAEWELVLLNTEPELSPDPVELSVAGGGSLNTNLSIYAVDAEDAVGIAFGKHLGPSWISVATNGLISGSPAAEDAGLNPLTLSLTDSGGAVGYGVVEITVGSTSGNFSQEVGGNGIVSMEAEHYHGLQAGSEGHNWTLVSGSYSGGEGMQALPDDGERNNSNFLTTSPRIDFDIDFVQTGTHYVWARAYAAGGAQNSVHAGLNDAFVATADKIENAAGSVVWVAYTRDGNNALRKHSFCRNAYPELLDARSRLCFG